MGVSPKFDLSEFNHTAQIIVNSANSDTFASMGQLQSALVKMKKMYGSATPDERASVSHTVEAVRLAGLQLNLRVPATAQEGADEPAPQMG